MKRIIGMILAVALLLTLFAGCGKEKNGAEASSGGHTTAASGEKETPAVPRMSLVVAGAFGDGSVFDSAKAGCERLAGEGLVTLRAVECGADELEGSLREAGENSELVVCMSRDPFEIGPVAAQFPNVRWICVDQTASEPLENVLYLCFKRSEGAFLAGYIAAAFSKAGVVGAVGGVESDSVNDCILGFEQGARYFKEDTVVLYDYAESSTDPAAAGACAASLHDQGADVILQAAGEAGTGVLDAAKLNGFYVVETEGAEQTLASEVVLCTVRLSVGDALYQAVKQDDLWGQTWAVGLAEGAVGLSWGDGSGSQPVSDEMRNEAEQLAAMICDGTIVVDGIIH